MKDNKETEMNDIVNIDTEEDLADSDLISYAYSAKNENITLFIKTWNCKTLKISFSDQILFIYDGYDFVEIFCEQKNKNNELLVKSIEKIYFKQERDHPYRLFQLVDVNYNPSIQVIATDFYCQLLDDITT